MPRTKGSKDILGWREHCLTRDLALGAESAEELSEEVRHCALDLYAFKERKKRQIAAVLADWANEFSNLPHGLLKALQGRGSCLLGEHHSGVYGRARGGCGPGHRDHAQA